jgi:hypothetical protein
MAIRRRPYTILSITGRFCGKWPLKKGTLIPINFYTKKDEFDLLLITTFTDQKQYDKREDYFAELIQKAGSLKLLNDKKPTEFRESWMSLENLGRLE